MKTFVMSKLISLSEETFKEEKVLTQPDVENKQLRKEENEKLRNEENEKLTSENEKLRKENEQLRKNNVVKDSKNKESIKIKSLEEDKNATDSYPNRITRIKQVY